MNINNNVPVRKRGRPTKAEQERLRQAQQTKVLLVDNYSPASSTFIKFHYN